MRALLLALLWLATQAIGQVSSSLPLVGQKWTTAPAACAVGQLGFDTDATAGSNLFGCTSANTWTALGGSASSIADLATAACSTANAVLYNATAPCSANLTFDTSTNRLTIGSGTTTSTGLTVGYSGTSGFARAWALGVTPDTTNYLFSVRQDGQLAYFNSSTGGTVSLAVGGTAKLDISGTGAAAQVTGNSGAGASIAAGTATTDVAALSVTRTNNNSAVATGVKITFTDTTSAAGFLPFQILCGSAATTNCLSVPKEGGIALVGKVISGTAPTVASGGCTTPTAVTSNGTAAFSVGVGTSCSGSQPLVFTLPAATTGWMCNAKNTTNGGTSAPAQTGAVSTTSVTITNFVRTTGVAGAWTDADVVVVSCMGY